MSKLHPNNVVLQLFGQCSIGMCINNLNNHLCKMFLTVLTSKLVILTILFL